MSSNSLESFEIIESYTEENFDHLPDKALEDIGDIIETPVMIIVRIFPAAGDNQKLHIGPTEFSYPEKISGKVLSVRLNSELMPTLKIHLKTSYRRASFWIKTLSSETSIVTVVQFRKGSTLVRTKPVITENLNTPEIFEVVDSGEFDQIILTSPNSRTQEFEIDHIRLYK
ncbi:hypothetical protein J3P75_13365 [Pseudomonas sp. R1-1]|uniref:hypothetical protein n=1 Tax=Pseudomonas sp. R1-1 TaxID=1602529 RepID=UPI003DA8D37A